MGSGIINVIYKIYDVPLSLLSPPVSSPVYPNLHSILFVAGDWENGLVLSDSEKKKTKEDTTHETRGGALRSGQVRSGAAGNRGATGGSTGHCRAGQGRTKETLH